MAKNNARQTVNSRSLSLFIGSRLMPGKDGKPQRKLTAKEAYDIAVKEEERRTQ